MDIGDGTIDAKWIADMELEPEWILKKKLQKLHR
jgi:hypothetical protein